MSQSTVRAYWLWWTSTTTFTIFCTAYTAIKNPQGAINTFLINCVDVILKVWPSTPENYTIGSMLTAFSAQFPNLGWGSIYEIINGIVGMLLIFSTVKIIKYIPFSG
jgi:hypothetical protein